MAITSTRPAALGCTITARTFMTAHASGAGTAPNGPPRPDRPLLHEEQSVEDDGFRERDGEDRLDHHLRRGSGISAHRFRSLGANTAHGHGRSQDPDTHVQVPAPVPF